MLNPLIQKLQHGADLTDEDRQVLEKAASDTQIVGPREDLINEGDLPDHVHLILEGFACRYKLLPNGERQIMAYLVPGDICDLHVSILGEMDHAISTLSRCKIVLIPRNIIEDITENHGRINRALWWATLVDAATCENGWSTWVAVLPTSSWRISCASYCCASRPWVSQARTAMSFRSRKPNLRTRLRSQLSMLIG